MSKLYSRIESLCNRKGVNITQMCRDAGVNRSALNELKAGRTKRLSAINLMRIADYFNVTVEYLLTDKKSAEESNLGAMREITMIPLYNSVSAGFGAYASDLVAGYVPTALHNGYNAKNLLAINVVGDSMSPEINDGDTVIVHKQDSVDSGTLAVVLMDGDAGFIKRVNYGSDWIELISYNKQYSPMRFEGADVLRLRVVGKVKEVIRHYG